MAPSSDYSSASGELWGLPLMPSTIEVELLLPNGIYLTLEAARELTLHNLKDMVWKQALRYPLYNELMEQGSYIFVGVTQDAECEEFYNEKRRLCDLHLFQPILRLVESEGNVQEKLLKNEIRQAIGMSVDEFDRISSQEVDDFRRNISTFCKSVIDKRLECTDALALIKYRYPPCMESAPTLPPHTKSKLLINRSWLVVRLWDKKSLQHTKLSIKVSYNATPSEVLTEALKKFSRLHKDIYPEKVRNISLKELESAGMYTLKVCGLNEYIVGNFPICQYRYIRQCVNRGINPDLMVVPTRDIIKNITSNVQYLQPQIAKCKPVTPNESLKLISRDILFRLHVISAAYVNTKEQDHTYIYVNLYHGSSPLCEPQKTSGMLCPPKWNEWLEFDIALCDMPRSIKLCISICALRKKKDKDEHWPLAWANIPLYDYLGCLLQGKVTLHLWPSSHLVEGSVHPLGVSGSNPCMDSPSVEVEFEDYGVEVLYPVDITSINCNLPVKSGQANGVDKSDNTKIDFTDINSNLDISSFSQIRDIISRDPLYEMSDDEKDLMWNNRKWCLQIPESLSKLLQSVKWENRHEVSQIYTLLRYWQILPPEIALELLDSKYPDPNVRAFATKCLQQTLSDDELLKYLLQLVLALKFEPYLLSPLAKYLLSKAMVNHQVCHYLFWHLKSEMHNKKVTLKFGLLLETLCRSCGSYLSDLTNQTEMLDKLVNLNTILKKEETLMCKMFRDHLAKPDFKELFENNTNPINPSQRLGELLSDLSEVKLSAKRPFVLKWRNDDPLASYFQPRWGILFKNGDDLRQDMLTLQIFKVMDDIWQRDGLDLCMTPYKCISMGYEIGMIEIVEKAETIMSIQKKGGVVGSLQLKSGMLHQWLRDKNPIELQYDSAVTNFTKSCAGYCVATFILGIGDRHNDNIMIKENGQLFHIDFGHFLNHKKKKYGIRRERVPFVLTDDFLKVICRGGNDAQNTVEFANFQDLCCKAYLSIRSHSKLILNLLSMMLGAEIPELSSFDDLEYVRQTLAVQQSESHANRRFRECMSDAHSGRWTTRVDWVCHAVKQGILKT
uniref:phosphatidylinositol-4,5-bisphosphate 3-kinase n=1 Tax=Halocynthia roretzi TaxID=7729 RepID=A0A0U4VVP9_HALRO|nr:Hr-PI3Kalpha protein [Halocynthia roretzi]